MEVIAVSSLSRGQREEGPWSRKRVEGWVPDSMIERGRGRERARAEGEPSNAEATVEMGGWKPNQSANLSGK